MIAETTISGTGNQATPLKGTTGEAAPVRNKSDHKMALVCA